MSTIEIQAFLSLDGLGDRPNQTLNPLKGEKVYEKIKG
jgi:hypothetical protein